MLNCFLTAGSGFGVGVEAGDSFFATILGVGVGLVLICCFTGVFGDFAAASFCGAGVGVGTTRGLVLRASAAGLLAAVVVGLAAVALG